MELVVILCLVALFYFIVSFFYEKRKLGIMFSAKDVSVASANGPSTVYGKIGAPSVINAMFSDDECVYCSLTIEYRHEYEDQLEWRIIHDDSQYVPFYVTDDSSAKLSLNPLLAEFDLYCNVSEDYSDIKDYPEAERKVKSLVIKSDYDCLKYPVRVRERILRRDDYITVVSDVRRKPYKEFVAEQKIEERELKELCEENKISWSSLPAAYADPGSSEVIYATGIGDSKVLVSDDTPAAMRKSSTRRRIIYFGGSVITSAVLLALLVHKIIGK